MSSVCVLLATVEYVGQCSYGVMDEPLTGSHRDSVLYLSPHGLEINRKQLCGNWDIPAELVL